MLGGSFILFLYLASSVEARLCFPEESASTIVETNCPPDWFCYKYHDRENSATTMGCTKYPWRIPMTVRGIIFKMRKEDNTDENKRPQVRAILSPDLTALESERYTYCATRELACDWRQNTLYDFSYEQLLSYLDWFEGAKYYMHQHSDRITEISDIEGKPIPWYYFNVLFGLFDFIYIFDQS